MWIQTKNNNNIQAKQLPSDSVIMQQEIYQIGAPITIVYNKDCWSNPKKILQNLHPRPVSWSWRWCRTSPRACIILKVITTRGIPLAVPLPHISTPSWGPARHSDTNYRQLDKTAWNTRIFSQNQQNLSYLQTHRWIQFLRNLVQDNQKQQSPHRINKTSPVPKSTYEIQFKKSSIYMLTTSLLLTTPMNIGFQNQL